LPAIANYVVTNATDTASLLQQIQSTLGHLKFQQTQNERDLQQEISTRNSIKNAADPRIATLETRIEGLRNDSKRLSTDVSEAERVIPLLENLLKLQRISVAISATL